jgi:hypothetical protein
MPQGNDAIKLNAKRSYTPEGYLVAPAIIARSGILPYYARELDLKDRAPNSIVQVYRSPNELAKAAPTFEHKPITMDHPPEGVDASTWRELAVGDVHDVLANSDKMLATVIVRDKAAIEEINKGRRQLSNGYTFELHPAAAGTQGYEFEQVDIQGNHIAIVDRARCGPSCVVGDRDPITSREEHKPMIKVAMDGYPGEVDEVTAGIIIQKLQHEKAATEERAAHPKFRIGDKLCDEAEANAIVNQLNVELARAKENTPEKFKQQYAAEQKVYACVKDMCPGIEIPENPDVNAVCTTALHQLEANAATKSQIAAILDGVAIDKASTLDLQRAVRTIHAATASDRDTSNQHRRNVQLGRTILATDSTTRDARTLDGRDAWVHRITHIMDEKTDDRSLEQL